ncbi:DUF4126 domain-containing protein [Fodinicola feengrottensis]|uniref:DUF4126 domain-containing protein n=1 Tax=Fodinicola feengrottensis TaxID=435914 RepID=A0ABN2IM68_9ACTN|nr:DUF4126 domain-containing protein [Fodinicola feengrottensis]
MIEVLTGMGLSASAGLNAYLPLLAVGLASKFTSFVAVPTGWMWLQNPWVLGVLGVLVVVEFVADKVPAVDHLNDIVQTVIRPSAGGLTFGAAASGETATFADPVTFLQNWNWVPIVVGVVIALFFHGGKATTRAVVNASTVGLGAPFVSFFEDIVSVVLILAAIFVPLLVLIFFAGMTVLFLWAFRRYRRRKARRSQPTLATP